MNPLFSFAIDTNEPFLQQIQGDMWTFQDADTFDYGAG